MKRRDFIGYGIKAAGASLIPAIQEASASVLPGAASEKWRTFELLTRVDIAPAHGVTKLWLPLPQQKYAAHQIAIPGRWSGNFNRAGLYKEPIHGVEAFYAEWDNSEEGMNVELVSPVSTRDYENFPGASKSRFTGTPENVSLFLKSSPNSPTDGIVLATAEKIVTGKQGALEKAQTIYNWIIDNGSRDPDTQGCGTGDVVAMLESGRISGKCADLNGLFVALAKSLGIPARDTSGIRVASSRHAKSLGVSSSDITKAQHCRAEFFLPDFGWVPVDPADVLKVAMEEKQPITSERIASERRRLFGSWEMNWVAYNTAKDFNISPPARSPLEFFMYPRAEIDKRVLNHLDPKGFSYQITAREVVS